MKLELDCRKLKESKLENLKQVILENGLHPSFCVIQVGDVDASNTYIRNKINAAKKLNIDYQHIKLGEDVSTEEVIDVIKGLNESSSCDGIFVQLPLPESLDKDAIINSIDVSKDVDGLTDLNIGRLTNKKDCLVACTPKGIMSILENLKVDLKGKKATIISRSSLVGCHLSNFYYKKI